MALQGNGPGREGGRAQQPGNEGGFLPRPHNKPSFQPFSTFATSRWVAFNPQNSPDSQPARGNWKVDKTHSQESKRDGCLT